MAGRLLDDGQIKLGGLGTQRELLESIGYLLFVASGTSCHAAMIGKILFQEICRLPASWENASELANQLHPIYPSNSAVWAISQSGETADLLLAMDQALKLGMPVLGLCNVVGSSVARKSCAGVYVNAGPEIGVASTKAFTAQVMVLQLISLYLRQLRRLDTPPWQNRFVRDLRAIPSLIARVVAQREEIRLLAEKYAGYPNFLYLGRGVNYPVALEGALKLKEISYRHAEGYSSGEMKHGPLALIDENFPTLVIIPREDDLYDKIISNIMEIKARGGPVLAIATEGDTDIASIVDDVFYVSRTSYYLTPLLTVVPLQLFAYFVAVLLDRNVDQPRNLAKAVTVE